MTLRYGRFINSFTCRANAESFIPFLPRAAKRFTDIDAKKMRPPVRHDQLLTSTSEDVVTPPYAFKCEARQFEQSPQFLKTDCVRPLSQPAPEFASLHIQTIAGARMVRRQAALAGSKASAACQHSYYSSSSRRRASTE